MSQRLSQASQKSQGTPRSQAPPISSRETQNVIQDVVRHFLMHDFDKHPIKLTDLRSVLKGQSKSSSAIIDQARILLRGVYGLELIQLDKPPKQFILINALDHQSHIACTEEVQSNLLLLGIILTYIFMTSGSKDGGVETAKLHEFLSTLDIDVRTKHDYFGDVNKVIDLLRSQHYLEFFKIDRTDPPKFEVKWGERAHHEFSLRKALEFASEMCNVENVEKWAAHYKTVLESEGIP